MSEKDQITSKTVSLLGFLRDIATLRRKRIASYGSEVRILWMADLPRNLPETWKNACKSAFIVGNPDDMPDLWLEVHKRRRPERPPIPDIVKDWVRLEDLDRIDQEPELRSEIAVIVEKQVPEANASPSQGRTLAERVPEVKRLEDHPEVQEAWLEYLVNCWEPWAEEMRQWQEVQQIYETVDFMYRRLEDAEERYELLLCVGLLQWRDSTGATIKRHVLVAPAEISLDAARGVLTVGPAASFEKFRIELDMLELQDRPRLEESGLKEQLEELLEELDVRAWDRHKVTEILRIIANKTRADAQVHEEEWEPRKQADDTFRILYAPALILRERRPTAYEELVSNLLYHYENNVGYSATTAPWERFISEGELSGPSSIKEPDIGFDDEDSRLYFPLPTNDEQRQIVESLRTRPYVLVKGPPGTGKSHTIANLICHLLAKGERILVTAHAPKALQVLHGLLPNDIRSLCVMAFGSSREDHWLLEESVRGIISRKNQWKDESAQSEIDRLEKELRQLEDEKVQVDRQLRECREAETYPHTLACGYSGTAAQIARRVEKEQERYGWFPELPDETVSCPLSPMEIEFLSEFHTSLTCESLRETQLEIVDFTLPDPREFKETVEKLREAERVFETALTGVSEEILRVLQGFSTAHLDTCRGFLSQLEEHATRASRMLGDLTGEIIKDYIVGRDTRWDRLEQEVADLVERIHAASDRAGRVPIELPSDVDNTKLLADTRQRLEHFKNGGRRGWGLLAPRVVRETRYIEERCRVNGMVPRDHKSLEMLCGFLELRELLQRFYSAWPQALSPRLSDPRRAAREVLDLVEEFRRLIGFLRAADRSVLGVVPIDQRPSLAEPGGRATWRRLIEAELTRRLAHQMREPLEEWLEEIRALPNDRIHPCMAELARAIEDRDPTRWSSAWEKRESIRAEKDRLQRYQQLLTNIRKVFPQLSDLLQSTQGDPEWKERLRQLGQAWAWAGARAWLRKVADPGHYEQLLEKSRRLEEKIRKKIGELAALKAWREFFRRLDNKTEQNLMAWTKAIARIGKGTGKYAYKHRRTSRQYLLECVPKIPAWIMPLHKLWETTESRPGVFDTVIIDEASQAGIEALALLLLAKRIIVVGDDKQNSPEAVGVPEDDIARLARDHLREFRFRDEFRPDTSLYDHAERAFGNVISLREHFRCVPEIIRFSNELCYTDAPLIPLRQPPPNRLPPLKAVFVEAGACEGEGQQIINRAEAERIIEKIQECLDDEAYRGKTMGVIILQGHAQAELIERRLAEVLEPKVREERKLRCGVPATFQGDQRDVIFLSLVVAPEHKYKKKGEYRFRALTELEAVRRFNVAMSRARDQVWLFHSVKLDDLENKEDLRWRLLNFFYAQDYGRAEIYEELERLEREVRRRRQPGEQPEPYESWFEVDVAIELLRRGYRIRPQVEFAGYRIDLVIEGLDKRLAVECDGEAWHGPERFEQDMARQRQLERAGWTFVRIRETEFYANRTEAIRRVVRTCTELGISPIIG